MIPRKFSVIALAIILTFTLAACGGDDDDNGGDDGGDSGGSVNLSQTITSESTDGTLTVSYPEGWAANEEFGSITIGTNEEVLALVMTSESGDTIPEDELGGQITLLPAEAASTFGTDLTSIMTAVTATFATPNDAGESVAFGDPQAFTVNGKNAVASTGDGTFSGVEASVTVILVEEGDGYVFGVFAAHQGDLGQFEDEARAISGSASFEPAAG